MSTSAIILILISAVAVWVAGVVFYAARDAIELNRPLRGRKWIPVFLWAPILILATILAVFESLRDTIVRWLTPKKLRSQIKCRTANHDTK